MKIRKLVIQNFSSHTMTALEFGAPCSLVVGALGVGKSSILQAIEYALTGECGYYRKRTDDRSELINERNAGFGMSIALYTDKGSATRSKSASAESWVWNDTVKQTVTAMDTAVTDALGVSKTILSAVLNVSNFFDLEDKVQKELIIGLIGAEVTHEKVVALFTGEPDALKLLRGQVTSLQAIQNAYDYAYERRTVARRDLKELKPPPAPEGQAPPIDRIRALLVQLDGEIQKKIGERGRLEGSSKVEGLRRELEARKTFLQNSAGAKNPVNVEQKLQNALDVACEALAQAAELAVGMEKSMNDIFKEFVLLEKNVALLTTFDGRCVAGSHACPAPMVDMQKALAEQQKELEKRREQHSKLDTERRELNRLATNRTEVVAAGEALRQYHESVAVYTRTHEEIGRIDAQLNAIVKPDTAQIEGVAADIEKLKERIQKGRQQLEAANGWLERERQVKAVAETRKKLETELAHLEELVTFFGPKGVKTQLIDERIGQFVDAINLHLKHFGFSVEISPEPWRMAVAGRSINRLSRSERFRLGICFQIGIAKLTGLSFVAIDEFELLTPDVRRSAMQMLHEADVQAIVVMTLMNEKVFIENRKNLPEYVEVIMVTNKEGVSIGVKV